MRGFFKFQSFKDSKCQSAKVPERQSSWGRITLWYFVLFFVNKPHRLHSYIDLGRIRRFALHSPHRFAHTFINLVSRKVAKSQSFSAISLLLWHSGTLKLWHFETLELWNFESLALKKKSYICPKQYELLISANSIIRYR